MAHAVPAVDEDDHQNRWREHLQNRDRESQKDKPNIDFEDAKQLLTQRYEEDDLPSPQDNTTGDELEKARYEAEVEFFDCTEETDREEVEALLERIVSHRYRNRFQESPEIIDLKDIPARRVIAAERLFQRKLIKLNGMEPDVISVGLDTPTWKSTLKDKFGPQEKYQLYLFEETVDVSCIHRSEKRGAWNKLWRKRLGEKFTFKVGFYTEIEPELQNILDRVLRGSRKELVEVFRAICRGHQVLNTNLRKMGAKSNDRNRFFRNCVHILHFEQSQHQSACFFEDEGDEWKLGMTVSFARLIKMLHDEHIDLSRLYKFQLYNTKKLMQHFVEVRKQCRKIDRLYQETYDVTLTKDQALKDLEFLYGDEM